MSKENHDREAMQTLMQRDSIQRLIEATEKQTRAVVEASEKQIKSNTEASEKQIKSNFRLLINFWAGVILILVVLVGVIVYMVTALGEVRSRHAIMTNMVSSALDAASDFTDEARRAMNRVDRKLTTQKKALPSAASEKGVNHGQDE